MAPRRDRCNECRWCGLRPTDVTGYWCEARARFLDRTELFLRVCDRFESWRGPAER